MASTETVAINPSLQTKTKLRAEHINMIFKRDGKTQRGRTARCDAAMHAITPGDERRVYSAGGGVIAHAARRPLAPGDGRSALRTR